MEVVMMTTSCDTNDENFEDDDIAISVIWRLT